MDLYALEDGYLVLTSLRVEDKFVSVFYTIPTTGDRYSYDGK